MARTFTREEFHALVWSKPMTHLAKEFAMSDVALHKICRKHDIPNPPLGWWAKKAAGQKVREIALPKAKAGIADRITIAGGDLSRESPALSEVREQARVVASAVPSGDPAPPHPIVTRTIEKLRKAKPSPTGLASSGGKGVIKCDVAYASIDRLAQFLPILVQAAELQGFSLTGGEDAASFAGKEELIGFSVELFRISDDSRVRIQIAVPQADAGRIPIGMQAKVGVAGAPGDAVNAVVVRTSSAIDAQSRTLRVELRLTEGSRAVLPGSFVEVTFMIPGGANTLQLPPNAVAFDGDGVRVATVGRGGRATWKDVRLGRDLGTSLEVLGGLSPGDLVVVNPPATLRNGDVVEIARSSRPGTVR